MKIYIDRKVHYEIERFYETSLLLHEALDEVTVNKKIDRLYDALEGLSIYAHIYAKARYKQEWIDAGYQEFICEDFHFAYQICLNEYGEEIVRIKDACHSLLYHN